MSTWADVGIDTYIRDRQGTIWRVCAVDERAASSGMSPAFRCSNSQGEWLNIAPKPLEMAVEIVSEVEEQITLLRDVLGAQIVATKNQADPGWTCPSWPASSGGSLDKYRTHLELAHGMYVGDVKTFARLVEAHEAAHESEPHVPHTHPTS